MLVSLILPLILSSASDYWLGLPLLLLCTTWFCEMLSVIWQKIPSKIRQMQQYALCEFNITIYQINITELRHIFKFKLFLISFCCKLLSLQFKLIRYILFYLILSLS